MTDPNSMLLSKKDFSAISSEFLMSMKKLESDFSGFAYLKLGMNEYNWLLRVDVSFSPMTSETINSIAKYPLDYHFNRAKSLIAVFNNKYSNIFSKITNFRQYRKQKSLVETIELFIMQLEVWKVNQKDKKVEIFTTFILKDNPLWEISKMTDAQALLFLDALTNNVNMSQFALRMRNLGPEESALKAALNDVLIELEADELINS